MMALAVRIPVYDRAGLMERMKGYRNLGQLQLGETPGAIGAATFTLMRSHAGLIIRH